MIPYRKFESHTLGTVFEDTRVTVFFGDKRSTDQALKLCFPDYQLSVMKQTHSDVVVKAPFVSSIEADAQITREKHLALCVRTADCVPVLIYDPDAEMVASVHAGWRGVENEIIRKTGAAMKEAGAELGSARAWIGPHIGSSSFEVGDDVAAKLEARLDAVRAYSDLKTAVLPHPTVGKKYVDLLGIVRAQLGSIGIERDRTLEHVIDTMMSPDHESFRRDRDRATRQVSFIALK